jgi:flagellar hook-associated protein 2
MGVTVDGLVSGLDTTSIIDAYMSVAEASTDRLRSQQTNLESRLTLLQELNGYLEDLESFIADFATEDDLDISSAISSNESVMTVTADNGAQAGTFAVDVVALAQSEMEVSQGYTDRDEVIATSGQLTVTVAGVDTVIDVSEANGNNKLSTLALYINENVEGASAYILDDGGATPYHLVIASEETGASQTLSFTSTLAGGTAPTFTEQLAAADAEMTIAGLTVYSDTNRFDDVIPGLNMEAASTGTATITSDMDVDGIVDSVQEFVDAYNAVANFIDDYTGMEADGNPSILAGESVLSTVQTNLQAVMSALYVEGDLQGTSILGFATQQDGTLELDTTDLRDALTNHPADAVAIIAGENGILQALDGRLDIVLDPDTGSMNLRQESLDQQIDDLQEQIEGSEANLEIYEQALRQQFTNLEIVLARMQTMSSYLTQLFSTNQQ